MQISEEEFKRLKEIEHLAWHLLDDSMDDGREITVDRTDFAKLSELLPEDHPEK